MPRPSDPSARARLLAGARRVFLEHGLDRAKVEDITQAAGLSKGSFYLHFQTKEQAFKEILSGALAELGLLLATAEQARGEQADASFEVVVDGWLDRDLQLFECIWKHRAIMRLVLEGGGSPDYQHLIELFAESAEQTTHRLIRFGIEHGYYRDGIDARQAATFVAGGYDRLARRLVRERRRPDLAAWLVGAQSLCVRALGTPEFVRAATNVYAARLSEPRRTATG
ncbi:MAG TPA: helix-turn-helix domain-containing protein [Polyangiaceae bacterium]